MTTRTRGKPRTRVRTHAQRATDYAKDVIAGRIVACLFVKLAAQRHLDDLTASKAKDYPYRFDQDATNRYCRFIELLPHTKGRWAANRELLRLEDWQCFTYGALFGWKRKTSGLRRFRRVYIEVPRKNAKSVITAGSGHYMLSADGEHGAEVYCGAGSEKQAWEVFNPAKIMAERTPDLRAAYGIEVNAKNINIKATDSKFEPVIGKPGDGPSPSFSISDEYHEHDTAEQYDAFITGMGAREQPIAWVITTAGDSIEGPCYAQHLEVEAMLKGTIPNDELWGVIFTIDEDDDWTSDEALRKANPNYGISVGEDYLKTQQRDAINDPRKQATCKTKHLNVWVTAANPYFNAEQWKRLGDAPPIAAFASQPCWVGLDLANKIDLVSVARIFSRDLPSVCAKCHGEKVVKPTAEEAVVSCPRCDGTGTHVEPHYYAYVNSYLPAAKAEDPALVHYHDWSERGHLIVTPGNVTDFDTVEDGLKADAARYRIVSLCFDPWNATQLTQHMQSHGVECVEVPQTTPHLSEPMKQLQAMITDGRFHHDGNPCTAWAIGNVTAQADRNENVFPRKQRPENKIDPAVAIINALVGAIKQPSASVYDKRDVRML